MDLNLMLNSESHNDKAQQGGDDNVSKGEVEVAQVAGNGHVELDVEEQEHKRVKRQRVMGEDEGGGRDRDEDKEGGSAAEVKEQQQPSGIQTKPAWATGGANTKSNSAIPAPVQNIMNYAPTEDLVRLIADYIYNFLVLNPLDNIEIEVKLGVLIDTQTRERLWIPILSEAVIDPANPSLRTRFESDMPAGVHRMFNNYLNKATSLTESEVKAAKANHSPPRVPLQYKHIYETDYFYESPDKGGQKLRVSRDTNTGAHLRTVIKMQVAELNIISPGTGFDWRLSINQEIPMPEPKLPESALKLQRVKNRMVYKHSNYQVDLTQVHISKHNTTSSSRGDDGPSVTHEVEVEYHRIDYLREQALKAKAGKSNQFADLVKAYIEGIRILTRQKE